MISCHSSPANIDSEPSTATGAYLLVPAGGCGLRMGGGVPKQFRDWGGRPLLRATIEAFLAPGMPRILGVSLSVPGDWIKEVGSWSLDVPMVITEGGPTRQASVAQALAALPEGPDRPVMIQDAVRPFPPREALYAALAALRDWDGALLAEPSTDTLKRVDCHGMVLVTEPRNEIFRAQTPQVATLGVWRRAFEWAQSSGFEGTDDASILEAMGLRVKVIPSPSSNVKLTTPEDWHRFAP
jgi:2-C-methyl-D-erythritol 4-phosphate cytidylyltransferase